MNPNQKLEEIYQEAINNQDYSEKLSKDEK